MTSLLDRNVLVVRQKAKLIEMNNEYAILDEEGVQIGKVRQEGQSKLKKVVRLVADVDQFLTHRLAIYDADGSKVLELVRPAKIFRSTLQVNDPAGAPRGRIVQQNIVGKKRFALEDATGRAIGSIDAENWRSWDFAVHDEQGLEVARISKKWSGALREIFTTADHYMVQVTGAPSKDLRFLLVGAAAAIDTALKQDDSGGWGFGGIDLWN
ncbi:MAG TPA: phospholipid scramblase-related protein [Actinomycetota bacterium]|nr:phospholipid scramblase-related protein [Actinomycetota bacterium]